MTKPVWEVVLEAELLRYHESGTHPQGLGIFTDLRQKILAEEAKRAELLTDEPFRRSIAALRASWITVPAWKKRTVAQVFLERATGGFACCDQNADMKACDCMVVAQEYEREIRSRGDSLAEHDPLRPTQCSICYNLNCDNPGGKH